MITIIDLKGMLGKMPMMRGRRPESTEAERKATGAFVTLAPFRDGNIYSAKFSGDAAWERHPNGDERFAVQNGTVEFRVGRRKVVAGPGDTISIGRPKLFAHPAWLPSFLGG